MASQDEKRGSLVATEPVTSVLPSNTVVSPKHIPSSSSSDEEVLAALGYKAEFKREFTLWTTFCVSFAVLGLLPSFASTLYFGMGYAGTAGMTWGWIIAMVFIICVAASMAELCSSMPTSGGLYYAAAVLAPPGYGPLGAWLTGWSNWLGQVTAAPSIFYALSAMLLSAASIGNTDYVASNYQIFLLTLLLMLMSMVVSSMPTLWLARLNSWGSTFNIISLIIVIILIPAATDWPALDLPKFTNSTAVWSEIYEGTEFPDGVSVLMSFISVIWTMSGYDAPFHLSEECSNANVAAPRAIVLTAVVGGIFGWFLQLVVAYTVIDINDVLDNDTIAQPYAAYLIQVLPQNTALAVLALTIVAGISMGQGNMLAASRVTFAYARDGCFPCSWWMARVNKVTGTPVNAVIFNGTIGILLTLLIFAGEVAINALFSIGALAAFVAFSIPISIRVFFVGDRFRPGPWNLGRYSKYVGSAGVAFVALMVPILCLPSVIGTDLTPDLMNWTCLVYGAPMLFAIVWWIISARKWFKGPRVNIEHHMLGREEAVLEGGAVQMHRVPSEDSGSGSGIAKEDHKSNLFA